MKSTAKLCLVAALLGNLYLRSAACADLRLVGTNLFDFSDAGSVYHIHGTVSKIYTQSIAVSFISGAGLFRLVNGQIAIRTMHDDSESMLAALTAYGIGNNANGTPRLINQGLYFSLSPEVRQYFEPATEYVTVYLLNPPAVNVGNSIDAVAVPTSNKGFWDCGAPFSGNQFDFKYIYRVLPDRIKRERQFSPEEIRAADLVLFSNQLQDASNNIAYCQFEVGKRYLTGRSVETNISLGLHWIKAAASNSLPAAIKFEKTNDFSIK